MAGAISPAEIRQGQIFPASIGKTGNISHLDLELITQRKAIKDTLK
jgi:hypothetical protein